MAKISKAADLRDDHMSVHENYVVARPFFVIEGEPSLNWCACCRYKPAHATTLTRLARRWVKQLHGELQQTLLENMMPPAIPLLC